MLKDEDVLLKNNSGNKSKNTLIDGFVIRTKEFKKIFEALKYRDQKRKHSHFLVIGQRGAGKTTLLHRLNYAVEDDPELSEQLIPIIFSEEQYHLSELTNLWESIAIFLEDHYGLSNLSSEIERLISRNELHEPLVFDYLISQVSKQHKTLVVFIENINVFFKKLDAPEKIRLKNILTKTNSLRIIGSSTTFNDSYIDFQSDFYDFFKIVPLNGLDKKEAEDLLIKIGEQYGAAEQIQEIIEKSPSRIEALRRLTGGVPRTIAYLFEIFLNNRNGKAITDLYILIDTLTFLYKSELDQLSTQQQKVVDVIARKWDAIGVREIAKATRYESKNISTILNGLEKNQLIERVSTSTKNNLYRIRERFMNIWYLMRFGRKHDQENIIWLVRFFDAWCEEKELSRIIAAHIDNLKEGSYDLNAAIDMGNAFLSCENVSESLKLQLLRMTKSILPKRLLDKVRFSSKNIHNTLAELINEQHFDEAFQMLEEIDVRDELYYMLASSLYLTTGQYDKSVEAAKQVLEFDKTNSTAALTLGIIYEDYIRDIDQAKVYYEMSLSQKLIHPYAASRLGDILFFYDNRPEKAIELHRRAIEKAFWPSLVSLGRIHHLIHEDDKALAYFKRAVSFKVENAYSKLAEFFSDLGDSKKARQAWENAIAHQEDRALIKAALFYENRKRPNYEKALSYYKQAIDSGITEAYSRLGKLYKNKLGLTDLAIETFTRGVIKNDAESAHQLAHAYADKGMYQESNDLFIQAFNGGKLTAIMCLVTEIYVTGRTAEKAFALQILEENAALLSKHFEITLLYARILLWNDQIEASIEMIRSAFPQLAKLKNNVEKNTHIENSSFVLNQLSQYFLLLIAKGKYQAALELFEDHEIVDLKILLRPVFFILMEYLKTEFPTEYLKAGDEFTETLSEIRDHIKNLQKMT